jgi:hypothetical protein
MNSPEVDAGSVGSLLLDSRTRALVRRTDPYEVRGAYEWVARAKRRASLSSATDAALMAVVPLVAEVRQDAGWTLGEALRGVRERRVRRLLASDCDDVIAQLIKVVRLIGRSVQIEDLVATAIFWDDHRRRKLAQAWFRQSDPGDDSSA